MPSNQKQITEQTEFTYSPLGKTFEKQTKTIEDQRTKQADALKNLILKDQTKSTEGIFQKIMKVMKLKMNYIKLKDLEIKLLEIICFMNQVSRYMTLKYLKQDLLVTVFITEKLKYMKLM